MGKRLTFLGMGVMGSAMAANLARAGFPLTVWNRTGDRPSLSEVAAAGAEVASSLEEAVREADLVFTCLGDVPDVEAVLLGAGGVATAAKPDTLVVDTSTIGPIAARSIAARLATFGLRFLDAPVSGGDLGARQGTLTFMVGGDAADVAACQPYFAVMGRAIRHCGPVGSGQAVKLCNQVLVAGTMLGLCEALHLAVRSGIDPTLAIEVCSSGAAASWSLSHLGPRIVARDFQPGFAIAHMLKDLGLVREAATAAEIELPAVELAERLWQWVAATDGGAALGTQAMALAYELPRSGDSVQ